MYMNGIREVEADAVSLGMEIEDDDFLGLMRGRFPFASAEGVDSGLSEDWVAPEHVGRLRGPISCNSSFDLHGTGNGHSLCQSGIDRNNLRHHLACFAFEHEEGESNYRRPFVTVVAHKI
jgi:hypothetical protein